MELLGKSRLATRHDGGWTFVRDVIEALEAVDAVPLPARFGFWAAQGGVAVEVAVRSKDAGVRASVGAALEQRGVPLKELRLVEHPGQLRWPMPLRCDLSEAVFTPAQDVDIETMTYRAEIRG